MKHYIQFFAILLLMISIAFTGCSDDSSSNDNPADTNYTDNNDDNGVNSETEDETVNIIFESITQIGGTLGTADTTALELAFDVDPETLTADDITVTGALKGALTGSGTARTLTITDITAADGGEVTVSISDPEGYTFSGSSKSATVYRLLTIGMDYLGGILAYIFQDGDPGYVEGETHGLIAASEDHDSLTTWALEDYQSAAVPSGTDTALGTGSSNTDNIISQHGGILTGYAAGIARSYDGGGYSDWFLPSKDELDKLYENKDSIGGFCGSDFWTSSEGGDSIVWTRGFAIGNSGFTSKTVTNDAVRATRYF